MGAGSNQVQDAGVLTEPSSVSSVSHARPLEPDNDAVPAPESKRRRLQGDETFASKAFLDSRRALLCDNAEWTYRRDQTTEVFRQHGSWALASQGKRLRAGGDSIAQRSWQYPYIQIYGTRWREALVPSYSQFHITIKLQNF